MAIEGMRDALVVLGAAAVVIPLFHRLRVSPVLGFMLVGMAVGPAGLGALADRVPPLSWITIADRGRIEPLAELGVVLLLFMIGLELSWERIKTMRRLVFGLGFLQLAGCTLAVAGAAVLAGVPPGAAGVVALALAMSSTAVVAQVLAEERRMTGLVGRVSFAVLLFQDLAVVPVLFTLGVLGQKSAAGEGTFALAIGQAPASPARRLRRSYSSRGITGASIFSSITVDRPQSSKAPDAASALTWSSIVACGIRPSYGCAYGWVYGCGHQGFARCSPERGRFVAIKAILWTLRP